MTETTTTQTDQTVPEYRQRVEDRAARERGEFVGFLACSHGPGRLFKVGQSDQRRPTVPCPVEGCPEGRHRVFMPRTRRRGESCDIELPPPTAAEPPRRRRLMGIGDSAFLAAIPADDTPAQIVADALGVGGSSRAADIAARAEWLNYDAGAERIVITRQGTPKPTLLRRSADA